MASSRAVQTVVVGSESIPQPLADVLVPGQLRPPAGGLVHEHRAEHGDVLADAAAGQVAEEGVLHVGEKQRVEVKLVDAPVAEAGLGGTGGSPRQVPVAPAFRVELKDDPVDDDVAEHQVVAAPAQGRQLVVGKQPSETDVPFLLEAGFEVVCE